MGQNVKLRIFDREYLLVANTPQAESRMRNAAEEINALLASYDERYPGKDREDKIAFIALNQAVSKLTYKESLESLSGEGRRLEAEIGSYLEGIGKNR